MVDLPNDGANKGAWRNQLRDRFGRFVDMGGPVSFEVQLPGVDGVSRGLGYFIGNTSLDLARISVKDNLSVPQGIYEIAPDKITAIQAIIKRDQLTENPDGSVSARSSKALAPTAEPLKDSMSGAEVQKKKLKSITTILKRQGRFAVPRQSNLDTWGKNSDVSLAAQADYKQVYDASPELQQLYDSAEDMWFRVFNLSVDTDTSSPNDLSQIPEEMKLLNREYAKHFLGLKEDGLITVYRNAVNGKDNEIDSAAGYVSTDMSLAYDYNSKKENIASNGRYEIDVKPDEVFGMLGYSKPEDEYAFVIGKGVTSQEGRVRRVGDLAPLPMPAPWLQQYAKDIQYSRGSTPYRHHALGGQFNFHEVENFGNDIKEFFAKYNLTADDIKSTFDKLNGDGAYEEYRESGNIVTFNGIRDMFVDLPSGKIGLDITKISGGSSQGITFHSYGDASKPDSFKNDRLDNTLKMLAVFQKLTGEPFFTHRSRDYVPTGETELPPLEEKTPEIPNVVKVEPPRAEEDLEITPAEEEAIAWYTDQGHDELNKSLREGAPLSPEGKLELESILGLIDRSPLENPMTVYRGRPVINPDRFAELDALKPGDTLIDKGIMSTSYSKDQADFYAQMPLEKSLGKFMLEIDLPAGAKAFAIPDYLASYGDTDKEILLQPDMPLEVVDVTTDSSGLKTIKLKPSTAESKGSDTPGVIDVVNEEASEARIEPGFDNWMPTLFELLDSLEEDEEGEEITKDERGNVLQSKFIKAAGFNGKPKLVTKKEFDAINSETLYRAVSDEKFVDDYINSETQYAGEGSRGNGTYTTTKRETTESYAGDFWSWIPTLGEEEVGDLDDETEQMLYDRWERILSNRTMEIKLSPDAKILDLDKAKLSDSAWTEENIDILLKKARKFGANPQNIQSIKNKLDNITDWTNIAIMLGYDGFRYLTNSKIGAVDKEYYTVIFNRGKVILNDKTRD
jgi:hypothetical protein